MGLKTSIITVVLNNELYIKDAIESVIAQHHTDVEYIIIDGGSNDGSLAIINTYKDKITVLVSEPDNGIYDAMNKGLALATGDVIGFLNADDFYANPNVLQTVANTFSQHNCDIVYADLNYVSRAHQDKVIRKWRSGNYKTNAFERGWMPPHPTFFAKRELYQRLGGYKQELNQSADYELMLRFIHVNHASVHYIPQVFVHMRVGGQSNRSLKNRLLANLQDRKAWTINGIRPKWYTLFFKPLSKVKQFFI